MKVISVIQLNTYIKKIFEQDFLLKNLNVEGELSNFKKHSSGHIYFTLKDDKAQVSCVLFSSYLNGSEKGLKDGDQVIVKGSVSLYEKSGQYQIYVREIEKSGQGNLHLQFEQLKDKLKKEGLFDEDHKKPIPNYARRIGIITSPTGAAIRDLVEIARRRNPYVELILFPALVQGEGAKYDLVRGLEYFNQDNSCDLIIIGRGGGSLEDLWAFNEEEVARGIYQSKIPVISAVGHESDITISDLVADLRASTPSAAAELAVFDYYAYRHKIALYRNRLLATQQQYFELRRERLAVYKARLLQKNPRYILEENLFDLDRRRQNLSKAFEHYIDKKRNELNVMKERLKGVSPTKRLSEGYGYIMKEQKGISSIEEISIGDSFQLYLSDGTLEAQVQAKSTYES